MSQWPSTKATRVLAALKRIGWVPVRSRGGSHVTLARDGVEYTWAFHDSVEIGPKMLSKIAKHTGLKPGDL